MENSTINDEIDLMITDRLNDLSKPELVTITKVYNDNHVDCKTKEENKLEYIPILASNPSKGDKGILFVLNDDSFYILSK